MKKLYVITRSDLEPGLEGAQACHAVATYCLRHTDEAFDWTQDENLIWLSTPNKEALEELVHKLKEAGILTATFHEPDVGNELTAVAAREEATPFVSSLPCALRRSRAA